MCFQENEVDELFSLWPGEEHRDGGQRYFLLPTLQLPHGCQPTALDALLCPHTRDGYPSRLYFQQVVQSPTQRNWNTMNVSIIGRNWSAFSWKVEPATTRLALIVRSFLRGLQ